MQGPPGSNAVAFAHLLVNHEAKVREQLEVESHRAACPLVAPVLEGVHVVDEVPVINVRDPA
jgi:hypothetical protein